MRPYTLGFHLPILGINGGFFIVDASAALVTVDISPQHGREKSSVDNEGGLNHGTARTVCAAPRLDGAASGFETEGASPSNVDAHFFGVSFCLDVLLKYVLFRIYGKVKTEWFCKVETEAGF